MPGIRTKSDPLIARQKVYPSDAGSAARSIRNLKIPGWEQIAGGFDNLGASLQQLHAAARQSDLEITEFVVTDPITGRIIASLGEYEKNGNKTSGGYFSELYAGDPYGNSDPADAILKVTRDGKVQVGENGWLDVLDPFAESAAWIGTQFDTMAVSGAVTSGGLIRLTVAEDVLVTGDLARVLDVGGVPNATGVFTVTRIDATHVDLQNSVFIGTYTSGGTIDRLLHITGAANDGAGLIRITRAAHGYEDGDKVNIQTVGGVPNATGQWIIDGVTTNTFDLLGSTWAGAYTSGGTALRYFAGGLFQTIAIGPSFDDYRLRAFANGDLRIRNSQITLNGSGAFIDIDPVQGKIVVASTAAAQYRTIIKDGTITLDVYDGDPISGSSDVDASMTNFYPGWMQLFKTDIFSAATSPILDLYGYSTASPWGPRIDIHQSGGTPTSPTATQPGDSMGGLVAWGYDTVGESQYSAGVRMVATELHGVAAHGTQIVFEVTPNGSAVGTVALIIDENSDAGFGGNVNAAGDINASGVFKKSGTPGINLTAGFGISLTVSNITNAVSGTPGVGQGNFTAVASVTLNAPSHTFSGGILTA